MPPGSAAGCRHHDDADPVRPPRKGRASVGSRGSNPANGRWRFLQDCWDELFDNGRASTKTKAWTVLGQRRRKMNSS